MDENKAAPEPPFLSLQFCRWDEIFRVLEREAWFQNENQTSQVFHLTSSHLDSDSVCARLWRIKQGSVFQCFFLLFFFLVDCNAEGGERRTIDLSLLFSLIPVQKGSAVPLAVLSHEAESVHMGIKRPTTLSSSSHTFCWSHLRFVFFFPFNNSVSFKTIFSQRENNKVSFFVITKKELSSFYVEKKGRKCRCAFLSDSQRRWQASRWRWDANTHWRRAWESQ